MATRLIAKFPDSFCQCPHHISAFMNAPGWHWQLLDAAGDCLVSVVGGDSKLWLHGDGVNTFEMWDKVNEIDPRPWMTKAEINAYLVERGIMDPVFEDLNIEIIEPKEKTS